MNRFVLGLVLATGGVFACTGQVVPGVGGTEDGGGSGRSSSDPGDKEPSADPGRDYPGKSGSTSPLAPACASVKAQ